MSSALTRRAALVASSAFVLTAPARAQDASALPVGPNTPMGGNPKGDVTIYTFFDYNCPYCKSTEPALLKAARADGRVRIVYYDWPFLTKSSVTGALLALAAHRQGQYEKVHAALMGVPGPRVPDKKMIDAVRASGVNLDKLQGELDRNTPALMEQIKANAALADKLGLQGTPVYVIGREVIGVSDEAGYRRAIAQARAGK